MINLLAKSSVERLIRNGIIAESERELYNYGVNGLYLSFINIVTSGIIGILFGMLWQSLLFSVAYIPLRSYAGGYHAKTPGRCYFLSTLLIACVLVVLKYVPFSMEGMYIALVIATAVIFVKAPVESENKPLNDRELKMFRTKARKILISETLLALILVAAHLSDVAECILLAILCSAGMLILPEQ